MSGLTTTIVADPCMEKSRHISDGGVFDSDQQISLTNLSFI